MIECIASDATAAEVAAEQWAQDARFRCGAAGIATTAAASVVVEGDLSTLARAFSLARAGLQP